MCPHVYLEGIGSCAGVVTLCATEMFFSRMGKHVYLEVSSLCAGVVTLCANKGLLAIVNQLVPFQLGSTDA